MENGPTAADQELDEYLSLVRALDLDAMLEILGIQKRSQAYLLEFFNRPILFDNHGFMDLSQKAITVSVKKVLCEYLIQCPKALFEPSDRLVTFREFPDSGPLRQIRVSPLI